MSELVLNPFVLFITLFFKSTENMEAKKYNRSQIEYIDELPNDVYEMSKILGYEFDRYWVDLKNARIIMKTKRGNKYKVIHPYYDKWNNTYYFNPIDINNISHHWRYYDVIMSYSPAYYLHVLL